MLFSILCYCYSRWWISWYRIRLDCRIASERTGVAADLRSWNVEKSSCRLTIDSIRDCWPKLSEKKSVIIRHWQRQCQLFCALRSDDWFYEQLFGIFCPSAKFAPSIGSHMVRVWTGFPSNADRFWISVHQWVFPPATNFNSCKL